MVELIKNINILAWPHLPLVSSAGLQMTVTSPELRVLLRTGARGVCTAPCTAPCTASGGEEHTGAGEEEEVQWWEVWLITTTSSLVCLGTKVR